MVALSQPCKKFPIVAAIATSTAPFILNNPEYNSN